MNPKTAKRRVDRLAAPIEAAAAPGPESLGHVSNAELARSLLAVESLFAEHFGCGQLLTDDDRRLCNRVIAEASA